jgi:hypothetical protein
LNNFFHIIIEPKYRVKFDSHTLGPIIYTNGSGLHKTSLTRELSLIIIGEIKENKVDRSKSEVEKEIDDVMNIIDREG